MAILIPGYKKSFKFHPLPLPYRPANWNCTHPPSSGSARPPARVLASGARHPSRSLSPFVCWPNRHILCQMPFDLDGGVCSAHWQAWSAPLRPPSWPVRHERATKNAVQKDTAQLYCSLSSSSRPSSPPPSLLTLRSSTFHRLPLKGFGGIHEAVLIGTVGNSYSHTLYLELGLPA